MKIVDVEAIYLRQRQVKEQCDSGQDALVVRVSTDAGITGIGEVDSSPMAESPRLSMFSNDRHGRICSLFTAYDQFPKLDVAGSSPVSRSIVSITCGDSSINTITALSRNSQIVKDLSVNFA